MTSHSWHPIIHVRVPRDLPFREARRYLIDVFEVEYVHALMARHKGDMAAASHAAGLSQRQLYALLQRHEQTHLRSPTDLRRWLPKRPRWLRLQWLTLAMLVLFLALM